ncbi:HoxN/HupN/NixA family nickel/cobalt transporter [Actinomadura rudentiformis]|uniref:Nickel transporter n=1 Tax=Actinomadura rudentiformis TaxID=359158 RepID=A0A6H9YML6_9ACTN|nr:nickel transporter [Actinomadura rudentiformis]KAB2347232.1 nickel transporter [Actinomadura rudentiformis]
MKRLGASLTLLAGLLLITLAQPTSASTTEASQAAPATSAFGNVPGAATLPQHPLGNFSVNRYDGLVVAPGELRVDHVQDLAEIPTAQAGPLLNADRQGWAAERCAEAARSMAGTAAQRPLTFTVRSSVVRTVPGQAGLPTARLECALVASAAEGPITFRDTGGAATVGWREITARGDRMTLTSSDVPTTSRSARLTAYPSDLLSSPLSQWTANLRVRAGGPALGPAETPVTEILPRGADKPARAFADLVANERLTLGFAVTALLIAIALGALHALAPGHGKTIMAAYAVSQGRRARRNILTLGITVTLTHTAGVLALGLIVLSGTVLAPGLVFGGLGAASGLLVAVAGTLMLRRAIRTFKTGTQTHTHAFGHAHAHPHGHGHGHTHSHQPRQRSTPESVQDSARPHLSHTSTSTLIRPAALNGAPSTGLDRRDPDGPEHTGPTEETHDASERSRGAALMGFAGGMVPSPSAVLVLIGAAAIGRAWFGVVLVLAYGVGLALTLILVGLFVMGTGRALASRLSDSSARPRLLRRVSARALPVATSLAVVLLGLGLMLRSLPTAFG